MGIFTTIRLLFLSIVIKIFTSLKGLQSGDIDTFIRFFGLRRIRKLGIARGLQLFINPISSIRYFEFDFVRKSLGKKRIKSILDISSPRAFSLFYAAHNPEVFYTMINPDILDRKETQTQIAALNLTNFNIVDENVLYLPYKANFFDVVISISVIEHIGQKDATRAIQQMWRVLKPSGKLIITTHVSSKYRVEYRDKDQYNLQKKKGKKYFFQRMYDTKNLEDQIISIIDVRPKIIEIIGEKQKGWFDKYIKRWIEKGLEETVRDPWYIMTKFKKYDSIKSLPGIGVIGLVFKKS